MKTRKTAKTVGKIATNYQVLDSEIFPCMRNYQLSL